VTQRHIMIRQEMGHKRQMVAVRTPVFWKYYCSKCYRHTELAQLNSQSQGHDVNIY